MSSALRVGIVGGLERNQARYEQIAAASGHELDYHAGHTSSRSTAQLAALVERCDLVVVTTDVNSHSAVRQTRQLARRYGRRVVLARRCDVSHFKDLLRNVARM